LATTRRFDFCRNVVTDLWNTVTNQWTRAGRNASECQADNGRETDPRGQDDCDYHEQNESTVRAFSDLNLETQLGKPAAEENRALRKTPWQTCLAPGNRTTF